MTLIRVEVTGPSATWSGPAHPADPAPVRPSGRAVHPFDKLRRSVGWRVRCPPHPSPVKTILDVERVGRTRHLVCHRDAHDLVYMVEAKRERIEKGRRPC